MKPLDNMPLFCGGAGGDSIKPKRWRYWGSDAAMADVTVTLNTCDPACAAGNTIDKGAVLVLDRVTTPKSGKSQFTRLTVLYDKPFKGGDDEAPDPAVDVKRPLYPQ